MKGGPAPPPAAHAAAGTFDFALAALGTQPGRTLHVGDSVHYDVGGARAAGLQAVHFDPRRLCEDGDHDHIASLRDLLD